MQLARKITSVLICTAIILTMGLNTPTSFASNVEVQITAIIYDSQGNQVKSDSYLQLESFEGFDGRVDGYWENGKFYYGGLTDGKYMLYAEAFGPLRSKDNIASAKRLIEIADRKLVSVDGNAVSDGTIVFNLLPAQAVVNAFSPDGQRVTDLSVNVLENTQYYKRYLYSVYPDNDGIIYIYGLEAGKDYSLEVFPDFETDLVSNGYIPVSINENGNYTGANPITVNLNKSQVQINLHNPDLSLAQEGYVEIKDGNDNYFQPYVGISNSLNIFKVGGLPDGNYTIRAYPYNAGYTRSFPHTFTIENGAVAIWDSKPTSGRVLFDMSFTYPQVTGKVSYPDTTESRFADVGVYEGADANRWVENIHAFDGTFRVGALEPNKTYTLIAYPQIEGYEISDPCIVKTDEFGNADPNQVELVLKSEVQDTIQVDAKNRIITIFIKKFVNEAGKASITIEDYLANEIISAAKGFKGNKDISIILNFAGLTDAKKIEVIISVQLLKGFANRMKIGSFTFSSEVGSITLDKSAIKKIEKNIRKNDKYITLSITNMKIIKYIKSVPKK